MKRISASMLTVFAMVGCASSPTMQIDHNADAYANVGPANYDNEDNRNPASTAQHSPMSASTIEALRQITYSPMELNLAVPVSSLSKEMQQGLIDAGLPIRSSGAIVTKTFPFSASASYLGNWEGIALFVTASHVYGRGAIKVTLGENSTQGPFDVWIQAAGGNAQGWGSTVNDTEIFAAIPSSQITDPAIRTAQAAAEARLKRIRPLEFSFDSPAQILKVDAGAQFYAIGHPLYFGTVGDITSNPTLWPVPVIQRYENAYRHYLIGSGQFTSQQLAQYKVNAPTSLGVLDLVPKDQASFSAPASLHPGVQTITPARLLRLAPPPQALPDPDGVQPGSSTGTPFLSGDGNVNYLPVAAESVGGDSGRAGVLLTKRSDGTPVALMVSNGNTSGVIPSDPAVTRAILSKIAGGDPAKLWNSNPVVFPPGVGDPTLPSYRPLADGTAVLVNYVPFSLEATNSAGLLKELQNPALRAGLTPEFNRALDSFVNYSLNTNSPATAAAIRKGL